MTNPWLDIVSFIGQRSPRTAAQLKGAQPREIARLQELHGRPLPNLYQLFLAAVGTECADFALIPCVDTRIGSLLEALPERHLATYPPERFLRIGLDTGGAGLSELYDIFIDQMACQALDCRVVGLEHYGLDDDPEPYAAGDEQDVGLDLWSQGLVSAVRQYVQKHAAERSRLFVRSQETNTTSKNPFADLVALTHRRHMTPMLPEAPRAFAAESSGPNGTVWLLHRSDAQKCVLEVVANDRATIDAQLALLDEYFRMEEFARG